VAPCLLSLACDACGGQHEVAAPRVDASPAVPEARADVLPAEAAAPPAAMGWAEAVRRERWDVAAHELDALAEPEKTRPEVLYVRARVALARGDAKAGLALLEGLDDALPLLTPDLARWRAEAKLVVGPYAEAGEYFASRGNAASLLRAAEAFEKAKDTARARALCSKAALIERRPRIEEAAARACRLRLADPADRSVAADARWIAVHAPDAPAAREADLALARLDTAHPLTGDELLVRARALADAGRTDDALRAIDRVASAPAPKVLHLDELRARGDVLYRAHNRHLEAARVLDECATGGGPHAAEDAFHAARALARADKDDDAIYRLTMLARSAAGTTWGDEATFFVPYLHMLHAKWKEASRGFDEYAQKYPGGVERKDAARDRALSHLMNGDAAIARRLFEQLAVDEPDALGSARAITMSALAALRDGDRTIALARWTDVATNKPLSWPALVSRARLKELGAPVPPGIAVRPDAAAVEPLPVALPAPVDMLHRIGLDSDAEASLHEREGGVSARAPAGRGLEALCNAYGQIGRGRRRLQLASQIPQDVFAQAPTARTRWAWECAYATPYASEVLAREETEQVSASLTFAVMRQESSFDPDAVSPAHAVGLMQLLPETASTVAAAMKLPFDEPRLTDPLYNVAIGVHYLQELIGRFKGQLPLAVAAYNAGHESVSRWASRSQGMELDAFVERIPYAETRVYVTRVMGNYARYEYLRHGEEGVPKVALGIVE
jgi:soluble lytic murein transglycosylase